MYEADEVIDQRKSNWFILNREWRFWGVIKLLLACFYNCSVSYFWWTYSVWQFWRVYCKNIFCVCTSCIVDEFWFFIKMLWSKIWNTCFVYKILICLYGHLALIWLVNCTGNCRDFVILLCSWQIYHKHICRLFILLLKC